MSYTGYPIIEEVTLTRREGLRLQHGPRPAVAVVIHQPGRPLVVLREPSDLPNRWDALRGSMTVYRVDLSPRMLDFHLAVPCLGEAFSFDVAVHVQCRVHDPEAVVRRHVEDVYGVIGPIVAGAVHVISRRYRHDDAASARDACSKEVRALIDVPLADGAFVVKSTGVTLNVDPLAVEKIRTTELLRLQGETAFLEAKQAIELQRLRGEALELETEQQIARFKRWVETYLPMIPGPDRHALAAMLANDHDAWPRVVGLLRGDQAAETANVVKILALLLEKGNLNATYDLDPVTQWVIRHFEQIDNPASRRQELPDIIGGEATPVDDPPSGDPPSGDPPSGDPPSGDPPSDDPPPSRVRRRTRR